MEKRSEQASEQLNTRPCLTEQQRLETPGKACTTWRRPLLNRTLHSSAPGAAAPPGDLSHQHLEFGVLLVLVCEPKRGQKGQ